MYALLAAALALAWLIPNACAAAAAPGPAAAGRDDVAFLPIFCANIVFSKRFADTADATTAFGANLLGAIIGGCLEYTALIVGYPALLGLAGILYLAAFALMPRGARVPISV